MKIKEKLSKFETFIADEIILNRCWIYDDEDSDPTREKDFIISMKYLKKIVPELFPDVTNLDDFLDTYCPEEDGEKIYQRAKKDGEIISEFIDITSFNLYSDDECIE